MTDTVTPNPANPGEETPIPPHQAEAEMEADEAVLGEPPPPPLNPPHAAAQAEPESREEEPPRPTPVLEDGVVVTTIAADDLFGSDSVVVFVEGEPSRVVVASSGTVAGIISGPPADAVFARLLMTGSPMTGQAAVRWTGQGYSIGVPPALTLIQRSR